MRIILFILASFYLSADDHEQSFEGLFYHLRDLILTEEWSL